MPKPQAVGEYRHYDYCRFCGSTQLEPVIDLGYMPLAGGFIPLEQAEQLIRDEKYFPLVIHFCKDCYLLQVVDVIDKSTLFKTYFYQSAAINTLVNYFSKVAQSVKKVLQTDTPFVVEIGANDGTFISALLQEKIKAVGIDPAQNIVGLAQKKGLPIELGFFNPVIAQKIVTQHGQADAIYSFNTLAHIEDMHEIIDSCKVLLKKNGSLIFEIHYVGSIIDELQYDMMYHEHQYYYSVLTLQKFFASHEMEIWNVQKTSTHAGSLQVSVQFKDTGKHSVNTAVDELILEEKEKKYHLIATYKKLGAKIAATKKNLVKLLEKLKGSGKVLAGYGASGRGTIISNYCGLNEKFFSYIIDDAPSKQGVLTPGVHLPVQSSEVLSTTDRPDYVVLFAWSFSNEIKKRNAIFVKKGGKFIVPLPTVQIL